MRKTFAALLSILLLFSFIITTSAYNDEYYDIEHDWLLDYGTKDGYTYEVHVPPHALHEFDITIHIDAPNDPITLVLQSVVTYTDDSFDLTIDNYGYGILCAEAIKHFAFDPDKTVVTLDFDCHIYENNIYQTTYGIRIYY